MLRFIENIIQCVNDVKAYRQFRKDVKYELSRADSKMTKYNIKENWLGNVLYVQINCTDLDLRTAEFDTDRMLLMKMKPIVEYLGDELGWSEYLVPQISNFVNDDGEHSLSYGVLFIFSGYSLTMTKLLGFVLIVLLLLGAGIWSLFHFLI